LDQNDGQSQGIAINTNIQSILLKSTKFAYTKQKSFFKLINLN